MVTVIRGSPSACLERALAEFESAYHYDPFSVCLIVPSHEIARSLRTRLTEDGKTLVKTAVNMLSELATERLHSSPKAPFVLTPLESEAVIRQIVVAKKDDLPLFYSNGELRQGLVPEARSFISTTIDFNIDYPSKLGDLASDKSEQLAAIRDAYLGTLHGKGHIDQHEVPSRTAKDIPGQKIWIKKLIFFGIYEPKPVEKDLIRALCGACSDSTYFAIDFDGHPAFGEGLSWLGASETEDLPISDRDKVVLGVFTSKAKSAGADLRVGDFTDPRDEARAVACQIKGLLSEGIEPERIGILLPMRSKSAPLFREVLSDFGIPANVRVPVKFSEALVVQTITDILELVIDDYPADDVIGLLSSPFIRFKFKNGSEEASLWSESVRHYVKRAGIRGGKERWLEPPAAAGGEDRAAPDPGVRAGLKELVTLLEGLRGARTLTDHIKSLRKVLDRLEVSKHQYFQDPQVMRRGQRALRMYFELLKDLDNASRLFSKEKIRLETFAGMHRGMVAGEEYYPDPHREKAVTVTGLRAGQLLDFDHAFIPGMVEGDLPRLRISHPFFPEQEVRQLGLLTGQEILRQERYFFILALLSSTGPVYLSTHRNEDDRRINRSAFLEAAESAIACGKMSPEDLSCSRVGSQLLVGQAISGKKVTLSSRPYGCGLDDSCLNINVEEFKRDGPYRTEYDGILSGKEVIADIARFHEDRTYSPKQLNMFYNCPLRYCLTYHHRMAPAREDEEASPVNTGSAVHTILQRFYRERCSGGKAKLSPAEREHAIRRLREIGSEKAAEGRSLAWRAYMDHFIGSSGVGVVDIFVDFELKDKLPEMAPKWIELAYGAHALEGGDPTSREEPVSIPLDDDGSRTMKMECRIDRTDSDPRGSFFVLDYKTGSPMRKSAAVKDLQIPLYILAVEAAVPGSRGIGGGLYYVSSRKNTRMVTTARDRDHAEMMVRLGKIDRREWDREKLDRLRTVLLKQWLDAMAAGRFHPSTSGSMSASMECGPDCEFYGACRFDRGRAMEMGLGRIDEEEEEE